jgi:uncharacterized protein YdeI (YjbR/CyaY-like superfamily)
MTDKPKLLFVATQGEWRDWLEKHHKTEKEVWLVYYKKHTGKPRIAYNDAVEEALSFGWIDSVVKRIDQDCFAQKFSARNLKRPYSPANKERLRALVQRGKVIEEVKATLGDVLKEASIEIPPDILKRIKSNKLAWKNFQAFSDGYKRIRIGFIDGARKRPEEFEKRLRHFIEETEKNKMFEFCGIEKHY